MEVFIETENSGYRKFNSPDEPEIWHFIKTAFVEETWIGIRETPFDSTEETIWGSPTQIFELTGIQL